jgi:hypothetical protein
MMTVLTIFVIFIWLTLLAGLFLAFLAWQKVAVFLKWNTRYQTAEYETAVTQVRPTTKPPLPAMKLKSAGRGVAQKDEFMELTEMPFEDAYKAVAEFGEVK